MCRLQPSSDSLKNALGLKLAFNDPDESGKQNMSVFIQHQNNFFLCNMYGKAKIYNILTFLMYFRLRKLELSVSMC